LLTRTRRTLHDEICLEPGAAVLVAVSGGPDSMVLLHALSRLSAEVSGKRNAFRIVAHGVDHGLRSEASAELDLAAALADRLGVPFARTRVDVARGGNLQARARAARYAALEAAAARAGATWLATAHHADDRAETVLLRLLRGAGPGGLAVLPPRSDRRIRPFIRARKAEILAHAARHGIPFAHDPSNDDVRHLRTRVRRELLPLLETMNPNIVVHLCALADALADALAETVPDALADAVPAGADTVAESLRPAADAPPHGPERGQGTLPRTGAPPYGLERVSSALAIELSRIPRPLPRAARLALRALLPARTPERVHDDPSRDASRDARSGGKGARHAIRRAERSRVSLPGGLVATYDRDHDELVVLRSAAEPSAERTESSVRADAREVPEVKGARRPKRAPDPATPTRKEASHDSTDAFSGGAVPAERRRAHRGHAPPDARAHDGGASAQAERGAARTTGPEQQGERQQAGIRGRGDDESDDEHDREHDRNHRNGPDDDGSDGRAPDRGGRRAP
jgi:tRNA(Ile)-lysidine synthase